jgi:RimJ/RimL family protein N-acetyltransferase
MQLLPFDKAAGFRAAAESWLASAERVNNLVLTALVAAQPGGVSRGWLVVAGETPQLALFQNAPHYLLLSHGSPEAGVCAAANLDAEVPGVSGPAPVTRAFATRWSERTGRLGVLNSEMTFFTLERVAPFRRPGGSLRAAVAEDFEELAPMAAAAAREMNLPRPEQEPERVERLLRRAISEGRQFIWADGPAIRTMASYVEALSHGGARIRGVFTPSEFRGRGYASAITGALAEKLLAAGQAWVSLFADNANPVSTGIYRRLGFRPHAAFLSVRFY